MICLEELAPRAFLKALRAAQRERKKREDLALVLQQQEIEVAVAVALGAVVYRFAVPKVVVFVAASVD